MSDDNNQSTSILDEALTFTEEQIRNAEVIGSFNLDETAGRDGETVTIDINSIKVVSSSAAPSRRVRDMIVDEDTPSESDAVPMDRSISDASTILLGGSSASVMQSDTDEYLPTDDNEDLFDSQSTNASIKSRNAGKVYSAI